MSTDLSGNQHIVKGSLWGALSYNINEMTGWSLGDPKPADIQLYSDLVWDKTVFRDIVGEIVDGFANYAKDAKDPKLTTIASGALAGENGRHETMMTAEEYKSHFGSDGALLGLGFFPWAPTALVKNGAYRVITRWDKKESHDVYHQVNPLRSEVLMIKLVTLLKITGIVAGTYYGIKYIRNRRR